MKNLKIYYLFLLTVVSGNTYTCFKGLDTFCEYIAGCYCCYDQEIWQAKQNGNKNRQKAIAKENIIMDRQIDSYLRLQQATAEKNNQNQTINNNIQENSAQQFIHALSVTSPISGNNNEDATQYNITNAVPSAFPDNNTEERTKEYSILNHPVNHYNQTNSETDNFCLHYSNSNTPNASNSARAYNSNNHNDQRLFVRQHSNNHENCNNDNAQNRSHSINNTLNNSPITSQYPTQNIQTRPYPNTSYIVDSIIPHFNNE